MENDKEISIIRWPELNKKLQGISRNTVDKWEKMGEFPKRIKLGRNSVAWIVSDINEWIVKRKEES